MLKKIHIILSLLLFAASVSAQDPAMTVAERNAAQGFNDTIDRLAPDFVTVSLVVCDPGDILYSVLGHACLRLQCPAFKMDYIFTYESEDVQGKLLRFFRNDLHMGMTALNMDDFLQPYIEEERGVREYTLNLPPEVKSELWRMCDERVAQGMLLAYDPVKRGCAISVVHSVEDAIKSANRITGKQYRITYPEWGTPFDRTLREIFYDNAPHGWGLFWCMTIVGGIVDEPHLKPKEKLICPKELADIWQQSSIDGKAIISSSPKSLCEGESIQPESFSPLYAALVVLLLAIISLFFKYPYLDWIIISIQTLFGCLILWLLVMPLPATGWNWLIVPFNILPAIFWHWRKYWALPYAAILFIWCLVMSGEFFWGHILVDWPHIILALSFIVVLVKQHFHAPF